MICGFVESFKSKRFCRICYASKEEYQELLEENENLLRDKTSYDRDIADKIFSDSGIKEECIFNKIENYDICENISVDEMHDLSEGAVSYSLSGSIEGLISTEKITLEKIKNRIESFPFCEREKSNKPRPLFYLQGKKGGKKTEN